VNLGNSGLTLTFHGMTDRVLEKRDRPTRDAGACSTFGRAPRVLTFPLITPWAIRASNHVWPTSCPQVLAQHEAQDGTLEQPEAEFEVRRHAGVRVEVYPS
jgi:hypothetical protein